MQKRITVEQYLQMGGVLKNILHVKAFNALNNQWGKLSYVGMEYGQHIVRVNNKRIPASFCYVTVEFDLHSRYRQNEP